MLAFNLTPIVGLPQFDGWSQVAVNSRHTFVCAFCVSGNNAGNVGRDVLDLLNSHSPTTAFDLHQLLSQVNENVARKECVVSVSAALLGEGKTALGVVDGSIVFKRGEKVATVLANTSLAVIEGNSKKGDTIVLLTKHAGIFSGEVQQKLVQGFDVDTIVTSLVPGVHSSAKSALHSIGFISVEEDKSGSVISDEEGEYESEEDSGQLPVIESSPSEQEDVNVVSHQVDTPPNSQSYSSRSFSQSKFAFVARTVVSTVVSTVARIFSRNDVYLQRAQSRRPKTIVLIVSVLVACLVLIGFVSWKWQQTEQLKVEVQSKIEPLLQSAQVAKSTADSDPIRAREQVTDVLVQLQQLQKQYETVPAVKKILENSVESVKQIATDVSGEKEVGELPLMYDLRLADSSFLASHFVVVDGTAFFVDVGQKKLLRVDLETKQQQSTSLSDQENISGVALVNGSPVLLTSGILAVADDDAFTKKQITESSDALRNSTMIASFADSNLYVLQPSARTVSKYVIGEDGTAKTASSWIKPGTSFPYDSVVSMVIDGDMWITTKTGEVLRYRSGAKTDFKPVGISEPLTGSTYIATTPDDTQVYVLDSTRRRVLVLSKDDGAVLKEITSPSLAAATALFENNLGEVFAVAGSLVYKVI